ncbi:MAG: hypothetical protein JWM70_1219, partial [Microbacteriaceae bacterium]|nr:hypothetical protein [Microbacteriaceae bacterium]
VTTLLDSGVMDHIRRDMSTHSGEDD